MIELIKTHNINIFLGFLIKRLKYHSYLVKYDNVQMEYKFSIPIFIYEARMRFRIQVAGTDAGAELGNFWESRVRMRRLKNY